MNNLLNAELSNDNSEVNIIPANPPKKTSYFSGTGLNSLLYFSGGRYWFATVLPFSVIGTLVQTTQVILWIIEIISRFLL